MSKLIGMKSITDHEKVSTVTLLAWIRELGYPARKAGGVWLSDTDSIEKWRKDFVEGNEVKKP